MSTLTHERFVRDYVWDDRNDWGCVGWRFAGNAVFRPADPRINAHDLLEHFPGDLGQEISGELEAMGAIWYGRVQSGLVYMPPVCATDRPDCTLRNANECRQVLQEELVLRGATRRILATAPAVGPVADTAIDECMRQVVARGANFVRQLLLTEEYLSAMRTILRLGGEAASVAIFRENHERLTNGDLELAALAWIRSGYNRAHERFGSPRRLANLYMKAYEGITKNSPGQRGDGLRICVDVDQESIEITRFRQQITEQPPEGIEISVSSRC